ncbi:Atu4866 domain-containing protein [Marinactinospora thermotolerans]|uniref:Dihydroorotase and related cyclic amidohydrolases n=1 Tax=Marinactinospora thermotolerans DSM 45154 TaxID=1122192 RepID=A0A1T4PSH8_9ACTN|nr:Atu4866 domain-containing protein [Marinactinospora thermotolerans]SJZ94369.1 Dihydroorotase and related cyclic amidohydrolases [Marinactinospora thermotolerans DSM 45154]
MSIRFDEDLLTTIAAEPHRPLLFVGATIHTLDPMIGDLSDADLLLGGKVIVGVGTGLHTAAEDDGAIVVDCAGLTIVPGIVEDDAVAGLRRRPSERVGTLAPGNPATFAVISGGHATTPALQRVVWRPEQAAAIVVDGEITLLNGRRLVEPREERFARRTPVDSPHLGMWIDETGFIHQELTADGRYDETRGGRPHAYQGSFWIEGDRIVYHDDLGFWAYGDFVDGVLHHAGYVFHRR